MSKKDTGMKGQAKAWWAMLGAALVMLGSVGNAHAAITSAPVWVGKNQIFYCSVTPDTGFGGGNICTSFHSQDGVQIYASVAAGSSVGCTFLDGNHVRTDYVIVTGVTAPAILAAPPGFYVCTVSSPGPNSLTDDHLRVAVQVFPGVGSNIPLATITAH